MARTGEAVFCHSRLNGGCKAETGNRRRRKEMGKTVRISVEVRSGTARFRVGLQAKCFTKALGVVGGSYPHGVVEVAFPIEPEGFFVHQHTHKEAA
jgi:hypothetical protein